MPFEKLQLETNIPATIALKYTQGKQVEGNYGPQIRYSLADGRNWYVPLVVADKVDDLDLGTNEPFTVCKREEKGASGKKHTVYLVYRPEDDATVKTVELKTPPPAAQRKPAPTTAANGQVPSQQPQVTNSPAVQTAAQPTVQTVQLRKYSDNAKRYMNAFVDAIDVIGEVGRYADEKRGIKLEFGTEDIRSIATTIFINGVKESRS